MTGVVLLAVLLAACEVFPVVPPTRPAGQPVEIEVVNRGITDAHITVSRPGNERHTVGVVQPNLVPVGETVLVVAYVPFNGEWAIFADGSEYMGSVDGQEGAQLRFRLTIQSQQGGYWEWR